MVTVLRGEGPMRLLRSRWTPKPMTACAVLTAAFAVLPIAGEGSNAQQSDQLGRGSRGSAGSMEQVTGWRSGDDPFRFEAAGERLVQIADPPSAVTGDSQGPSGGPWPVDRDGGAAGGAAAAGVRNSMGSIDVETPPSDEPWVPGLLPPEFIVSAARVFPVSSSAIARGSVWVKDGRIHQIGKLEIHADGTRIMTCEGGCTLQVGDQVPVLSSPSAWVIPGPVDASEWIARCPRFARGAVEMAGAGAAESAAGLLLDLESQVEGPRPAGGGDVPSKAGAASFGTGSDAILRRLREALEQARKAMEQQELSRAGSGAGSSGRSGAPAASGEGPDTSAGGAVLRSVLSGEIPLIVRARRASEILAAIGLSDALGIRMILDQGTEAWKVADELFARRIPVILGPLTRRDAEDGLEASYESASRLRGKGIAVAIRSGDGRSPGSPRSEAALAVAYGLDWEEAIRMLTLAPAEILGVADRIGSLAPGTEASFLLTDGDPLEIRTRVLGGVYNGMPAAPPEF